MSKPDYASENKDRMDCSTTCLMIRLYMVLSIFLLAADEISAMEIDGKITMNTTVSVFPESTKNTQENTVVSASLFPDFNLLFSEAARAVIAPRLRLGISDSEYHLISLDDFYGEFASENLEIRIGYQTLFWGTVESRNIVDILNQKNYVANFLDPEKLGEPMTRVSFFLENYRLDFYYLPHFTPAPFPGKKNRYNFFDGLLSVSEDPFYTSDARRLRQQFAFRWDATVGSADLGISYFNGYEKFPIIFLQLGEPEADSLYYEMQQWSIDVQISLGNWLYKLELLRQDTGIGGSFSKQILLPNGRVARKNIVPEAHTASVVGFEYTFVGVFEKNDVGFLGEYLYDSEQNLDALTFRPFQNDLFIGFRWVRNNYGDAQLLSGLILDLKNNSRLWRFEYSERYDDRYKVTAIIDMIDVASEDPFSTFNNDDRFSVNISYTF